MSGKGAVLGEPQMTSLDPNERKLARKLRIERRWQTMQKYTMTTPHSDGEEIGTIIQDQVQKSAELLEKFIQEAEEYITNVRVANIAREVDRRENEGIGKEKVIAQLQNEADAAQKAFEEIAVKWSVIQKYNDPLHINEDIANQKEKCDLLIKQKDGIIVMLRDQLKEAEIKFTKDQKKQMEDINTLAQRIEKQITFMRRAYQNEFRLIEEVIASERQNIIDLNNKKWEELYITRDRKETENSNTKFRHLEEFNGKMTRIRIDFQESFRETKIKLENDIESLQREMERIKALALMNSEKLDYNYQILKKREDENLIIKSQQKRRMNKLHDVINDLKKNITDYETSTNNKIKKLTENIQKLLKNILEVEAKAEHFAKVNDEKFHQVWEMNKESCQDMLTKILSTDKILYEQQMGIAWVPPPHNLTHKTNLPSYKNAIAIISDASCVSNVPSCLSRNSTKMKKIKSSESEEEKVEKLKDYDSNTYKRLLRHILTRVSEKSGFLTEKRLKTILKPYENPQKTIIRLGNVFESLGINKPEDMDLLVKYFLPYAYCLICSSLEEQTEASILSRYTSQLSHLSSAFTRVDNENIEIIELEQAFSAIQLPDQLIQEVVLDLVSSDAFLDEEEEIKADESMDQICGGVVLDQYYSDLKEKRTTKKKTFVTEEKIMCQFSHPLVISSIYILAALREFVAFYYKQKKGTPTTKERLERKRNTVSRLLQDNDIKAYWEKYKLVYSEERIRIWDALLEGLKKYHEILKDRKSICEEVVALRRQNEDLKRLLANYIDHGEYTNNPPCTLEKEQCLNTTPPPYANAKYK